MGNDFRLVLSGVLPPGTQHGGNMSMALAPHALRWTDSDLPNRVRTYVARVESLLIDEIRVDQLAQVAPASRLFCVVAAVVQM